MTKPKTIEEARKKRLSRLMTIGIVLSLPAYLLLFYSLYAYYINDPGTWNYFALSLYCFLMREIVDLKIEVLSNKYEIEVLRRLAEISIDNER